MNIPKDPVMLLSFINTQLRDNDSSLEEFCNRHSIDIHLITDALAKINYHYEPTQNQFK